MNIDFKKIFHKHQFTLILLGLFILVQLIISSVFPYITKYIVDDVLVKQQLKNLNLILLITVILVVLLIPVNVAVSYFSSKWTQSVVFDLRQMIGGRFLSSKENSENNGLFINTITNDSDIIGNQLLSILLNSVPNVLLTVLYLFILISLNLKLTLITLIGIPFFLLLAFITSKKVFDLSKKLQKYRDKLVEFLNIYVRNKLLIDLYGLRKDEQGKFSDVTRQVKKVNIKTSTILSFLNNVTGLLATVIPLASLLIGSVMVIGGELSLGSLIAFNSYTALLFSPLGKLLNIPALFSQMKVSINRVRESSFSVIGNRAGSYEETSLNSPQQLIVKDLVPIVENKALFSTGLSFTVSQGEFLRISGANGVGKSVFLKCLINYQDFVGSIIKQNGQRIVYVPQENFLFDGTIKENLVKGLPDYEDGQLARFVQLLEFELPLTQKVSPFQMNLSSGQLQKIKIIRALLSQPDILILDEVLANLEDKVIVELLDFIKKSNLTTLFIYHGNFDSFLAEMEYKLVNLNLIVEVSNGNVYSSHS